MPEKEQVKPQSQTTKAELAEELDVAIEAGLKLREQGAAGETDINVYKC